MATEKQIAANRLNALKSTGPKTAEGKARSRRNGVKHNLTGDGIVRDDALEAELAAELAGFADHFAPRDLVERRLVEQMALSGLRARRCKAAAEQRHRDRHRHAVRDWDSARAAEVAAAAARLDDDPASALAELERTAEGCDDLWDRWDALKSALAAAGAWTPEQAQQALRLLGEAEAPTDRSACRPALLSLCALALRPDPAAASYYFEGAADPLSLLPDPPSALATLADLIDEELARLADLGDRLWESYDAPDRAAAPALALVGTDAEADRLERYETTAQRRFQHALAALFAGRRPSPRAAVPPRPLAAPEPVRERPAAPPAPASVPPPRQDEANSRPAPTPSPRPLTPAPSPHPSSSSVRSPSPVTLL